MSFKKTKKQKEFNKKSSIPTYLGLSTMMLGVMFISPLLNKEIKANTTKNKGLLNTVAPIINPSGNLASEEYLKEQQFINELYKLTSQNSYKESQLLNYNFSDTKGPDQPGNVYPDIVEPTLANIYVNMGKINDSTGRRTLEQSPTAGFSYSEFYKDPGTFCVEWGVPLTGRPDDSRGLSIAPTGSIETTNFESLNNIFANMQDSTGSTMNLGSNNLSALNVQDINDRGRVNASLGNGINYNYTGSNSQGSTTSVNQSRTRKSQPKIRRGIENLVKSELSSYLITTDDGAKVFLYGLLKNMESRIIQVLEKKFKPRINALQERALANARSFTGIGPAPGNATSDTVGIPMFSGYLNFNSSEDAQIAYIVSSYVERAYGEGERLNIHDVTPSGFDTMQRAIWQSDAAHNVDASSVPTSGAGNSLAAKARDFSKYISELTSFQSRAGQPNRAYQRFLGTDAYHADIMITENTYNMRGGVNEEVIIYNPRVRYEPILKDGLSGSTNEDRIKEVSKVKFDTTKNKWIIGPYQLDYLKRKQEGTDKYFANLNNIKLFGEYIDSNGNTQASNQVVSTSSRPPRRESPTRSQGINRFGLPGDTLLPLESESNVSQDIENKKINDAIKKMEEFKEKYGTGLDIYNDGIDTNPFNRRNIEASNTMYSKLKKENQKKFYRLLYYSYPELLQKETVQVPQYLDIETGSEKLTNEDVQEVARAFSSDNPYIFMVNRSDFSIERTEKYNERNEYVGTLWNINKVGFTDFVNKLYTDYNMEKTAGATATIRSFLNNSRNQETLRMINNTYSRDYENVDYVIKILLNNIYWIEAKRDYAGLKSGIEIGAPNNRELANSLKYYLKNMNIPSAVISARKGGELRTLVLVKFAGTNYYALDLEEIFEKKKSNAEFEEIYMGKTTLNQKGYELDYPTNIDREMYNLVSEQDFLITNASNRHIRRSTYPKFSDFFNSFIGSEERLRKLAGIDEDTKIIGVKENFLNTETGTYITEDELRQIEQNPDKFNTAEEERNLNISEIKKGGWDILKEDGSSARSGKLDPNEKFYFVIDYDPALQNIVKARFEFSYMIFGGSKNIYKMSRTGYDNIDVDVEITNVDIFEKGLVKINEEDRMEGGIADTVDIRYIPKFSVENIQEQTQMNVQAMRWIEEVAIEINFIPDDPDEPGDPGKERKEFSIKLRLPIGGKVWEDKEDTDRKHVGYDNIYGTTNDKYLENVKVTIFRVLARVDSNKKPVEILDRQYARLFDVNSGEMITDIHNIYTNANGEYGPFDIHDVGFTKSESNRIGENFTNYAILFDVRFDYDGITYEPVVPMATLTENPSQISAVKDSISRFNMGDTAYKKDYEKSSFAFENNENRIRFNMANATIAGKTTNDGSGNTGITVSNNLESSRDIKYSTTQKVDTGTTKIIESKYITEFPGSSRHKSIGSEEYTNTFINASTIEIGVKLPANEKIVYNSENDVQIALNNYAGTYYTTRYYMKNINLGLRRRKAVQVGLKKDLNNALLFVNKKATSYSFKDLNDAMRTKEEVENNTGTLIDLPELKGEISENKKNALLELYKTDYIYRTTMYSSNEPLIQTLERYIDEEVSLDKQIQDSVNKDQIKRDPRQLDVYAVYKIEVKNFSPVDTVKVNAIDDYYNKKMELVNKQIIKRIQEDPEFREDSIENISDKKYSLADKELRIATPHYSIRKKNQTEVPKLVDSLGTESLVAKKLYEEGNDFSTEEYKRGKDHFDVNAVDLSRIYNERGELYLEPGDAVDIFLTFRIKNAENIYEVNNTNSSELGSLSSLIGKEEGIKKLDNALNLGEFENLAEIVSFTTYDTLTGYNSGKVDYVSAPDNVDVSKITNRSEKINIEADTDNAGLFKLRIKPDNENNTRKLSGTVWEDKRDVENRGIITGDGKLKDGEETISNMPVTLEERISLKNDRKLHNLLFKGQKNDLSEVEYIDVPFIWPKKIRASTIELDLKAVTEFESTVVTDENGKYSYTGVPAGNMVVTMYYTSPNKEKLDEIFNEKGDMYQYFDTMIYDNLNNKGKNDNTFISEKDLIQVANKENRNVKFYNGMDFKNSTFYADSNQNPLLKTWIDKDKDSIPDNSFLLDDEMRRIEITKTFEVLDSSKDQLLDLFSDVNSFTGDNNNEKLKEVLALTTMKAVTPKMNFSIEYYEKLNKENSFKETSDNSYSNINEEKTPLHVLDAYKNIYAVKGIYENGDQDDYNDETGMKNVKDLGYDVQHINLALVERPRTKIVMNKEITNVTLTTSNGDKPIELFYNIKAELNKVKNDNKYSKNYEPTNEDTVEFKRELDTTKSRGAETVMQLDRNAKTDGKIEGFNKEDLRNQLNTVAAGFRYLNIDKALLQDSTISIEYGIFAYNLSEVDRKVDLAKAQEDNLISQNVGEINGIEVVIPNPDYNDQFIKEDLNRRIYREKSMRTGKDLGTGELYLLSDYVPKMQLGYYVGKEYYIIDKDNNKTPLSNEEISKVTVTDVADFVDNDTNINLDDKKNESWFNADKYDLVDKIQNLTSGNVETVEILDSNGNNYIQDLGATLNNESVTTISSILDDKSKTPKNSNIDSNIYMINRNSFKLVPFRWEKENDELVVMTNDENEGYVKEFKFINRWNIKTDKNISRDSSGNELNFDNISEIIGYSTENGRRDDDITPGNVVTLIDKYAENGNGIIPGVEVPDSSGISNIIPDRPENLSPDKIVAIGTTLEHDSSSTENVTLSPPTGLSEVKIAKNAAIITTIITLGLTVIIFNISKKIK